MKPHSYSEEEKTMYHMLKTAETIEEYEKLGWPELTGTIKQIPWAMGIKIKAVKSFKEVQNKNCFKSYMKTDYDFYRSIIDGIDVEEVKEFMITNFIMKCNDSFYLIRNRSKEPKRLLIEYIRDAWEDGILPERIGVE